MKNIILISGTMGVGKSATAKALKSKLNNSVFLDGDWCWDMNPFQVTDETKAMVIENICFLLNNFIKCSAYDNIIFCWVMNKQEIIDDIISRLETENCKIHSVSLVCTERALESRLEKDIIVGIREKDIIKRSLERLPLYNLLNTDKLDVSERAPDQVADLIIERYLSLKTK